MLTAWNWLFSLLAHPSARGIMAECALGENASGALSFTITIGSSIHKSIEGRY